MQITESDLEPPGCQLAEADPWKWASSEDWNDWRWQLRNRITTLSELERIIELTPAEVEGVKRASSLPMAITPYFSRLIDPSNPNCPLRKQVIPCFAESVITKHDMIDPCGEDAHSPVPGLVHRYPDRVLVILTDLCAAYCRYCTRRRRVGQGEATLTGENLRKICSYLRSHKKVRDVLISGGDPFILGDERLEEVLASIRAIAHIEILRMGTRVPVTLPQRIDEKLASMLKNYHPLYLSLHFSHPKEVTEEVKRACSILADSGIPLGSQTVLLKGINDAPNVMKKLMHELLKIRVKPYYIYQADLVAGTAHFRTPISTGIKIMEKLRGYTTGYAVPTFVVDAPGGGGKVPIGPNYIVSNEKSGLVVRNYEGRSFYYS